ncbi:MAG TPA: hypothetical protein VNT79_09150 [Phycisphaerae bacterium]|nr:hypothetical protein [Phycisphaerae bacterium]
MRAFSTILGIGLFLVTVPSPGCGTSQRSVPHTREELQSVSSSLLSGFDTLLEAPGGFGDGAETLYHVDIQHGRTTENFFLRLRLHEMDLRKIKRVRVNPGGVAPVMDTDVIIRDEKQPSYDMNVQLWQFFLTSAPDAKPAPTVPASSGTPTSQPATNPIVNEPQKLQSDSLLAWVGLYDAGGELLNARYVLLPEACLRGGFVKPALYELASLGKSEPDAALKIRIHRALLEAHSAMSMLSTIVLSTPLLKPIVREFVPLWVKLSVIFRRPKVLLSIGKVERFEGDIPGLPPEYVSDACRISYALSVNEHEIIRSSLVAAPPKSPIHPGAGVLQMEGESSSDSSRRVRIRLIAARRTGGTSVCPETLSGELPLPPAME